MAHSDVAPETSGHRVRVKNTFLELDLPKTDLRRLETCPGRVSAPKCATGARTSWADMDSDDELEPKAAPKPAPKPAQKHSWADMESDDEDFEQTVTKTPPEPEAERSPRPPVQDEWSTVQRKGAKQKNPPTARANETRPASQPEVPQQQPAAPTDEWNTVRRKGKKPSKEEPPVVAHAHPARERPSVADHRREPQLQPRTQGADASRSRAPDRKRPEKRVEVAMEESPSFPVVKRLIGPSGGNLKRIRENCPRAVVSLRGRGCPGSGSDLDQDAPLHFVISAPNDEIEKAVRMVESLVADVRGQRDRLAQKRP